MKSKFAPSLMCMDFMRIRDQIEALDCRADYLHVDIMDGHYVRNITLSPGFVRSVAGVAKTPIDVHLMVDNPGDYIEELADCGAAVISPHAECINRDAFRVIEKIKRLGCKVGVVLNPATPISYISTYIHHVDLLTFMTVDPGFPGQTFIREMLPKIAEAVELRRKNGYKYEIQIDGACKAGLYRDLYDAGTDVFIIGASGLFSLDDDVSRAWDKMLQIFDEETGERVS